MKYILFWLLAFQTSADSLHAQQTTATEQPVTEQRAAVAVAPTSIHDALDSLLLRHVSDLGVVNYKGLKKDREALEAYLQVLSDNVPQETDSREAQMAYWINAYNAFTLHLIVKNYPVTSITKFDDGKTWDVKRITLANKKYSLNKIENEILRPKFKDARIHFAVNCAAKSCPPLHNRAYTADNLEQLLDERTRAFVNNPKYNTLGKQSVKISKIFEWYAADFGNIQTFLNKYSDKKVNAKATVTYDEYNWDLNEK
jgi:hypothetical protein